MKKNILSNPKAVDRVPEHVIARFSVNLDFSDEGVDLQASTTIIGDDKAAARYAPVFEADLRRVYSHLFPVPEPQIEEEI